MYTKSANHMLEKQALTFPIDGNLYIEWINT